MFAVPVERTRGVLTAVFKCRAFLFSTTVEGFRCWDQTAETIFTIMPLPLLLNLVTKLLFLLVMITARHSSKIRLMRSLVTCIFLYACESWTLTADLKKKNTSLGNEVLPQDTIHLIQRPCYQRRSPYQDPAGNWTTRRPDDRKETQTAVVWSCLPFIRSGQNHLSRHSERGKKARQTGEEVGIQYQEMDRPGVRQVPEGSGEQRKMEKTGCEIICAPTTLAVKG